MKVLSVKQPWASLIVEGIKDIENRTWPCPKKYIGQRVLIHTGMAKRQSLQELLTIEQLKAFNQSMPHEYDFDKMFPKGLIIGSVEIVDCVINHPSIWAEKTKGKIDLNKGLLTLADGQKPIYNWVLANPIKFPEPIPTKGKLRFWEFEL